MVELGLGLELGLTTLLGEEDALLGMSTTPCGSMPVSKPMESKGRRALPSFATRGRHVHVKANGVYCELGHRGSTPMVPIAKGGNRGGICIIGWWDMQHRCQYCHAHTGKYDTLALTHPVRPLSFRTTTSVKPSWAFPM